MKLFDDWREELKRIKKAVKQAALAKTELASIDQRVKAMQAERDKLQRKNQKPTPQQQDALVGCLIVLPLRQCHLPDR